MYLRKRLREAWERNRGNKEEEKKQTYRKWDKTLLTLLKNLVQGYPNFFAFFVFHFLV